MEDTVEHQVDGLAERIIAEDAERRAQDLVSCVSHAEPPHVAHKHDVPADPAVQDLFNIAPKRPNWDLKRELDKKLGKLERKTQESVHTLIRECPRTLSRIALPVP